MSLKKITLNWKASILYFVFIQAIFFCFSFFLSGLIVMPIRFIFHSEIAQDIAFIISFFFIESISKFIIFFITFKNDKHNTFPQFCINYSLTFVLRLIFCLIFSFNFISAGATTTALGIFLAKLFIDENIITMQQVPTSIYISIFVAFEALAILIAFCASKFSTYLKTKEHNELHGK